MPVISDAAMMYKVFYCSYCEDLKDVISMWVCDVVWSRLAPAPVSICFLVGLVVEACDISVSLGTLGADNGVINNNTMQC